MAMRGPPVCRGASSPWPGGSTAPTFDILRSGLPCSTGGSGPRVAPPVSPVAWAPGVPPGTSYLVDSASSHMLVSKIKPCMSKYKQFIQ